MNKKALLIFLISTFTLTIALIIGARLSGFSLVDKPVLMGQMAIAAAMFIPGICAILTHKLVLKKPFKELGFRFGPFRDYVKVYFSIVGLFVLTYAITWLFFLKPDFTLAPFLAQYGITASLPMSAPAMLGIFAIITFIGAPIFNMIPSMGEEIGWRGFLLPNLEPLGKTKAALFSGMIWALWHTPMILILGFAYGSQMWTGAIFHFVLVTSLGVWMANIYFKNRSVVLASFIHAVFNANAYGVWTMIFVSENRLLIGSTGIINVLLVFMLGIVGLLAIKRSFQSIPDIISAK
ncbi:MAG: CPBP family intramembrane glutamic endopeptidase [Acidobacteriaceae bacterium]